MKLANGTRVLVKSACAAGVFSMVQFAAGFADDSSPEDGLVRRCLAHEAWSGLPEAQDICQCVDEKSRGKETVRNLLLASLTDGEMLDEGNAAREIVDSCMQSAR